MTAAWWYRHRRRRRSSVLPLLLCCLCIHQLLQPLLKASHVYALRATVEHEAAQSMFKLPPDAPGVLSSIPPEAARPPSPTAPPRSHSQSQPSATAAAPDELLSPASSLSQLLTSLWSMLPGSPSSDESRSMPSQTRHSRSSSSATAAAVEPSHSSLHTLNFAATDNAPPSYLPTARLTVPLTPLGDGAHWAMTLLQGSLGIGAAATTPDFSSRTVKLVLDLGTGDIILYNKTTCILCCTELVCSTSACDPTPPLLCDSSFRSTSLSDYYLSTVTSANYRMSVYLDGEFLQSSASYSVAGARELLVASVYLQGSGQAQYYTHRPPLLIVSGSILGTPASLIQVTTVSGGTTIISNMDPTDVTTMAIINAAYASRANGVVGLAHYAAAAISREYSAALTEKGKTPFQALFADAYSDPTSIDANGGYSRALVLGVDFAGGNMFVGGVDESRRNSIVWATPSPADTSAAAQLSQLYHTFNLYDFTICGVKPFANTSAPAWPAILDSGSSCLGLPREVYDLLISWLPIECTLGIGDARPRVCQFKWTSLTTLPTLPTVSFRLSPTGTQLHIDLAQLLFQQVPNKQRLCIWRGYSMVDGPTPSNAIYFGGRVLKQFYVALSLQQTFDSSGHVTSSSSTVGFAPTTAPTAASNVQCASRVQCPGMMQKFDALSACLPPDCDAYYFFSYDPATQRCALNTRFHAFCGIFIALFFSLELFLNETIMWLWKKVQNEGIAVGRL